MLIDMDVIRELILKDIKYLFRVKSSLLSPIIFSFIASFIISLSVPQDILKEYAFPIMWIVFIFASVFPSLELMRYEVESGILEGLMSSSLKKEVFFLSKFISALIMYIITGISLFFVFFFFANFSPSFYALLSFFLSAIGVSSLSVLFASLYTKDFLKIPIYVVLFPFYIPLIISAIEITRENFSAFKLIFGFDIINFSLAFALFDISFE